MKIRQVLLVISLAWLGMVGCDEQGEILNGDHSSALGETVEAMDLNATCGGDLSGDGEIGMADLVLLLTAWGECDHCPADLSGDNSVGMADLTALIGNWGPCTNTCNTSSAGAWQNHPLAPAQFGLVTVTFEATAQSGMTEAIVALGPSAGSSFGDFAVLVRFASNGKIDARSGGDYVADVSYPYSVGTTYLVRIEIDVIQKRYSVYVGELGESEVAVATSLAFRSEQSGATSIAHYALWSDAGSLEVCGFEAEQAPAQCADGIDNDEDGFTDLDDEGCDDASDNREEEFEATEMACPSEAAIQAALTGQMQWFDPGLSGGAHSWVFNGAEFGKAATSFCGDTRTDVKLLAQIRNLLIPGNGVSATGGFQDQKQLGATSMFTLAKQMPRIWDQLSALEKNKIDHMMNGVLVSSAFTTSDSNYFIVNGQTQHSLNGGTNMNRSWNPNHRNGMIGQVIVATMYFGLDEAKRLIKEHDHTVFIQELRNLDLDNLVWTYTRSNSVTAAQVEYTLHKPFFYFNIAHDDIMGLFTHVTEYTYSGTVWCGVSNNQGAIGSRNGVRGGYMTQGCVSLPNIGEAGMLFEFHAFDGYGQRSSSHYAHDGWYVNNYTHYMIAAMGYWEDTPASSILVDKIKVGTNDLEYKLDANRGGGYHDLANGNGQAAAEKLDYQQGSNEWGHRINFSIVNDVLLPFHGK